jgi:hypothetical protein
MPEYDDKGRIGEDWKREYEKIILSRKYAEASSAIGSCFAQPTIENVKIAYGATVDFVTAIPIPEQDNLKGRRTGFLNDLDEIGLIVHGNYDQENVKELLKEYGLMISKVKQGVRTYDVLQNLPELVKKIRNILIEAGEFATSAGLRITLAKKQSEGMMKIMEEEGFDDLDVGIEE